MITGELIVRISVRKWIYVPYAWGLLFMARLTGLEPDWKKVDAFIGKYCIKVKAP